MFILIFSLSFICNINIIRCQENNEIYLIGEINKAMLQQHPYSKWFNNEYNNYKPDETIIKELKKQNYENIKITIFLGTWCEDSKIYVPRFIKILDEISFNYKNLKMYALNKNKEFAGNYKIEKIPTFVFEKDNKKLGEINEKPKKNLEYDFLKIIKKQ